MQPLDLSFMAPLSTYYSQEIEVWLRNNPGKVVTLYQISRLFGSVYLKTATPNNAIQGFSKSGIYPVNRYVFTDDMFSASFPTDIHQQQDNENGDENSLDDQSASNNTDLNILDTNAITQNSVINIGISSSGDILTCSLAQDDNIPSTSSSYI